MNVLSDIDEDNFDRAFALLRPGEWSIVDGGKVSFNIYFVVIQGASDMGQRLSETELQKSLDFCAHFFNPTTPEDRVRVSQRPGIGQELLDITAPVMDPSSLQRIFTASNARMADDATGADEGKSSNTGAIDKMVLDKVNAQRIVLPDQSLNGIEAEPLAGYLMRLEKGKLGLMKSNV